MQSLDEYAHAELAKLEADTLRRTLAVTDPATGLADPPWVMRNGRRLLSFSSNDYLNLSTHPAVVAAAVAATEQYGAGAGASRLVTGNHPLYQALEQRLATLKGTAAACVFGSGYLANVGIISALAGPGDLVVVDALAHSCIWAGARVSGAQVRRFKHNDVADLDRLLQAERTAARRVLICTDHVFSMDGDLAPVPALAALAAQYDCWLMTDDAHGLGVVPQAPGAALQMGTLSKAAGGYGGYLCASRPVIELLHNRARSVVYSTALPPGTVAAASAALDFMANNSAYCALPLQHARLFCSAVGLPEPPSPIVAVLVGAADRALAASAMLEDAGFLVVAIRPPTVPVRTARLRLAFTARHDPADIWRLAELVRPLLA